MPKEELCSIYDNVAVTCKLTDAAEEGMQHLYRFLSIVTFALEDYCEALLCNCAVGGSATQPTLLNEALAGGFAKAWSVGLELHEVRKQLPDRGHGAGHIRHTLKLALM